MKNKLENLVNFDDFKSSWKAEQAKKTKRTETGLDILKENVEEIIPEGIPDDEEIEQTPKIQPKYGLDDDKLEKIEEFLNDDPDDDVVDEMVNQLRQMLLEMEQMGLVDETTTDELDDKYSDSDDWIGWIMDVIHLEDFPEEGLNNLMKVIEHVTKDNLDVPEEEGVFEFEDDDEEDDEDEDDELSLPEDDTPDFEEK